MLTTWALHDATDESPGKENPNRVCVVRKELSSWALNVPDWQVGKQKKGSSSNSNSNRNYTTKRRRLIMVGKWDPSAKEGRKMGGSCPASFLDDDDDDDASEVKWRFLFRTSIFSAKLDAVETRPDCTGGYFSLSINSLTWLDSTRLNEWEKRGYNGMEFGSDNNSTRLFDR